MSNEDLQELVKEISMKYFKKPFKHQCFFNFRLRTTGGRYLLHSHNIEINPKYYKEQGIEEVIGIIKHELCHYHLHIEGKGYRHRDKDFRELLLKTGAPRFCKPLKSNREKKVSKVIHLYCCKQCKQLYRRKRKINTLRYVCGVCKGKLEKVNE